MRKDEDIEEIFQIPTIFFRFQQPFFFFFTPATDRTDWHSPSPETDSTNFSSGWFRVPLPLHPTLAGRVRVGPKTDPARLVDSPNCKKSESSLGCPNNLKKMPNDTFLIYMDIKVVSFFFFFFSDLETSCRRWRGESIPNEQMLTCLIINLNS